MMIEESATVIDCNGQYATLTTQAKAACGSCSAGSGCGVSLVAGFFKRRSQSIVALNPIQARPGQRVVVGLSESSLLRASFALYLLPLVCMLITAMLGEQISLVWSLAETELMTVIGGLLGLMMGFLLLYYLSLKNRADPAFQPVILRKESEIPVQFN